MPKIHAPLRVTVSPLAGSDSFVVRFNGAVLIDSSRQPLLDSARQLAAVGFAPERKLELWHAGASQFAMRAPLGTAAVLVANGGRFRLRRPHHKARTDVTRHVTVETERVVAPGCAEKNLDANGDRIAIEIVKLLQSFSTFDPTRPSPIP